MKHLKLGIVIFLAIMSQRLWSQRLNQVWFTKEMTDSCEAVYQLILNDGYFTKTRYRSDNGGFISTKGGKFTLTGDSIRFSYEFDSEDKTKVGSVSTYYFKENDGTLSLRSQRKSRTLRPKEPYEVTDLTGTYLFSGRKEKSGEISRRNTDQPRKTMKILSGQHFQWIAYNTETGEFSGTGGGRYTAVNGKYQETIEFFSRNNARVGAQLNFEFDKKDNDWHHSGLSSAGEPIYEIWSIRNK